IRRKTDVPAHIRERRVAAAHSVAEGHLPEDVLHFRRTFELLPRKATEHHERSAIQEILRINIERFLKHLDDPYKSVRMLDGEGKFTLKKSHRVYHFYACLEANVFDSLDGKKSAGSPSFKVVRVVMDKTGINRVDPVDLPSGT